MTGSPNSTKPSGTKPTPMMEQYIEIKTANPDSLLFYRMGDFYELFFDDAEIASRALGIALTKRGKHAGEDIPMCGVPVHTADDYLQKLIALGHRVAVCEQMEDPAEAKKRGYKAVVKRDVVRLVTPGTITEDNLLEPGRSNYLMAIGRVKSDDKGYALAWTDISTGQFRTLATSLERLITDITTYEPSEIILAQSVAIDPDLVGLLSPFKNVVPQPDSLFSSSSAEHRISTYYDVKTLSGFGDFGRAELSAISGLIAYVQATQKDGRPPLERPERLQASQAMFIDPATRANLELTRTLSGKRAGSLLAAIDRTVTGAGARLLAEYVTAPLTDKHQIDDRLDAVSYLKTQLELAQKTAENLKSLPDMARALTRIALDRSGPRDLQQIMQAIAAAQRLSDLLADYQLPPALTMIAQSLSKLPEQLYKSLSDALAEELPLLKRDGGFIRTGYDPELDQLRTMTSQSKQIIAALQAEYSDVTNVKSLKIKHNNVLGYFVEVTAQNSQSLFEFQGDDSIKFHHRQTLANAVRFTTNRLVELETKIANASGLAIEREQNHYHQLSLDIIDAGDQLHKAGRVLAQLDVFHSLAKLAEEQKYCRPTIEQSFGFEIEDGRHPVVEQALKTRNQAPFVANSCDLSGAGAAKPGAIWLLTGPNMGGKSTYLRQNALIALMAQMGSYVPASRARIGLVDRLFSRVGASDDLSQGRSTFMVEMVETAAILNQSTERSLVILDEIGRGTATYDGLSIAWATVEYLHENNRCRTLFATHFHELTALGSKLARLTNVTMQVREWKSDVVFLHQVVPGAADRSYGVQVAALAGLPAAVIARAKDVLQQLERNPAHGKVENLVDDLPLFSINNTNLPARADQSDLLREHLDSIVIDEMTPRQALETLYELKALAVRQ